MITAIGGFLLTFDTPLLKLADADLWTVMFWRGVLVFATICAYWAVLQWIIRRPIPMINGLAGFSVSLLYGIANIFFITALHNTTVANLVFILALTPLVTAGFSILFLAERIPRGTLLAILVAIGGVLIIVGDGIAQGSSFGDLLAVGSVICMSSALTITRGSGRDMSMAPGPAALAGAAFAFLFIDSFALDVSQWAYLLINGVIIMPISTVLLALGPRYISAPEVGMFLLLETVLAPIWVWLAVNEVPTTNSLIGGAVIVLALGGHSVFRFVRNRSR